MSLVHTARIGPSMTVQTKGIPDSSGGDTSFALTASYRSTKSIICKAIWSDVRALPAGGSETLDLTALSGADVMPDADFTGFKVVGLGLDAPEANTANITFDAGAANGYNFLGTASSHLDLQPNGAYACDLPTGTPLVSTTVKNIDVAGTAADVYDIILAAI